MNFRWILPHQIFALTPMSLDFHLRCHWRKAQARTAQGGWNWNRFLGLHNPARPHNYRHNPHHANKDSALCFGGLVKAHEKSTWKKKPSKNLQSRALSNESTLVWYFYGNPRKLRVFQMPLTILIGIERARSAQRLNKWSVLLLCFFSFFSPSWARSEEEKKSWNFYLAQTLFLRFRSSIFSRSQNRQASQKKKKHVNGLRYTFTEGSGSLGKHKKQKSLLLKVIESYFGINHFRISWKRLLFIDFSLHARL